MSSDKVIVAVDAMGGDNAPQEIVKGAVNAVNMNSRLGVVLVGPEDLIQKELDQLDYSKNRIRIRNASEVITTDDVPTIAIKKKKDSSIVVGQAMVRDGEADAFVSAGSTGAVLVGGIFITGRIRGIERPPLGVLIPTEKGVALLVDCGANMDCRSSHLVQFAQMGSIYMEKALKIEKPRVAILNVGLEDEKGNALVKETKPLLAALDNINYIGSIEGREVTSGYADVIVADGFTGNCCLKMSEGVVKTMLHVIKGSLTSSLKTKIGALLIKKALKGAVKRFDATEYGGAPILGLNGLVVKCHGNATEKEIGYAIQQCITFKEEGVNDAIRETLGRKKKAEKAEEN